MHQFFIKTPWLVKKLFSQYIWNFPGADNEVYLTFGDGPHPQITPWVLDELSNYHAHASFFCIGKNVLEHPQVYQRILQEGHAVGNHTHTHVNGWKVATDQYLADIHQATAYIKTNLFRPPYGRIKQKHLTHLNEAMGTATKVIMWDVLSADFDQTYSPEKCLQHVVQNVTAGSVIVFHDSEKAYTNLMYALPKTLQYLNEKGFVCRKIEIGKTV